jgi:Protein of unknown function (DUF2806)
MDTETASVLTALLAFLGVTGPQALRLLEAIYHQWSLPNFIQQKARAEAEARKIAAKSKQEVKLIEAQGKAELEDAATNLRIQKAENKAIVAKAIQELRRTHLALMSGNPDLKDIVSKIVELLRRDPTGPITLRNADLNALVAEAFDDESIKADALDDLSIKAIERAAYVERRRQECLDGIIDKAVKIADENKEPPSEKKVDPDWTAEFFNNSQDVSNEDMQTLWAKILAGEVASPGSFSKKTLAVVKTMSKTEAEDFTKLATNVWLIDVRQEPFIVALDANKCGLSFNALRNLEDLGLISVTFPGISYQFSSNALCVYFGRAFHGATDQPKSLNLGTLALTRAGTELFRICKAEPDFRTMAEVMAVFSKEIPFQEVVITPVANGVHVQPLQ